MSFLESRAHSARQGIGKAVPRREDARLLSGGGRFADDFTLPGQAYACLVRSPHPHARIVRVDIADALAGAGVIAVLTGKDAQADGLQPIPHRPMPGNPHEVPLRSRDGSEFLIAPHRVLAADKVRFVGEAVAIVVAETLPAAMDGAEAVLVEYDPLPAVARSREALEPGAPLVWEELGRNLCIDSHTGDAAATQAAFDKAAHVVKLDTTVHRVTGVPMEPRAALGAYATATGRYTLFTSAGGGVVRQRDDVAAVLGVPPAAVRVVSGDVGGNFGTRNSTYPEYVLVVWAARRVGRPVKWTSERREAFLSDYHGRDLMSQAELALDEAGRILALRAVNTSNLGASALSFIPLAKGIAVSTSVYHVPVAYIRGQAVLTNTSPTGPYRSAGRPEVIFVIERLLDIAARRHGFDRVELRRRNLVPPSAMPYRNALGLVYDSGDYPAAMARALELADWAGFEARRTRARKRGRYRGIGLANSIELNSGVPRERAELTVHPQGRIEVVLGTMCAGQGHATSFPQMIAEWLGVGIDQVDLVTGDTDRVRAGGGSSSGRSMRLGGVVLAKASDQALEKGRRIAASLLEAAESDIEFVQGAFVLKGTDRCVGLFEAAAAALGEAIPAELRGPLAGVSEEVMSVPSYPYTCAVCEVEIDAETGVVEVLSFLTVDDCGRAVSPLLVHGQTHGAIAQGIGQSLFERCHYDENAQLLSASFMDYAIPRAEDLPSFATEILEIASTTNPLGMRGGSEGGITPSFAVIGNAIVDALAEFGIEHIELPATPQRVWSAIRAARGSEAPKI
jgi:carbon-monoxide dehydrogenase large subunit